MCFMMQHQTVNELLNTEDKNKNNIVMKALVYIW